MFYKNIGPNVCIDETSLSDGELYTIVTNKDAHGGKGAIIAIVKGTKVETVVEALKHILWYERAKVLEVTMDFSESMHSIVVQSFPYATITIPDFDKSFNEGGAISDFQVVSNISISKWVTQTIFSVPLRHVCTKEKTPQREYWSDRGG